jgi:hypothetical protein
VPARLIDDLRFSTPVLTPNGDGANDQVEISLVIFKVEATDPRVEIFDLSGRTVALLLPSTTGPTTRFTRWWWPTESRRSMHPHPRHSKDQHTAATVPPVRRYRAVLRSTAGSGDG